MHVVLTERTIETLQRHDVYFSLSGEQRLKPGDVLFFSQDLRMEPFSACLAGQVLISSGSFSYSWSALPEGLSIGRYCSISWNLKTVAPNHPTAFVSTSSFTYDDSFAIFSRALAGRPITRYPAPVTRPNREDLPQIADDVWIGQDVTLARGIALGTGCVVAANSVVTKSVPPYAIVGGNPAKVIRMRFPETTVERLLASRWWTYNFADFASMRYDDPEIFLDQLAAAAAAGDISPFEPVPLTAKDLLEG